MMLAEAAQATTYFVATNGSGSSLGTNTAWKTIGKAATNMFPGDIALIRGGIYREAVTANRSGTASGIYKNNCNENSPITRRTNHPQSSNMLCPLGCIDAAISLCRVQCG
jgi:hypothetical protein